MPGFDLEDMPRRQLLHIGEDGVRGGDVLQRQVRVERGWIELSSDALVSQQGRDQRMTDPSRNGTVLSGDLLGNDAPDAPRWDLSQQDNAQHVVDAGVCVQPSE